MEKLIPVWCAYDSVQVVIGYFSTEAAAIQYLKDVGEKGVGNSGVYCELAVQMSDGRIFILAKKDPIDLDKRKETKESLLRAGALAKLTAEERQVLGL